MKRQRETIIPPSETRSPGPGVKGRVAATDMKGATDAIRLYAYSYSQCINAKHCVFVSDELSMQDPESNMKLAQRIEKDVVSAGVTA